MLLFSDSFTVRTMFTKIDRVLIDPSASICPRRFNLPPKEYELLILNKLREKIVELSKDAEYIIVTHYHWDHVPHPDLDWMYEIFKDKKVFLKDFRNMHLSGQRRGYIVYKKILEKTKNVEFVDGKEVENFIFSPPFWHGAPGSKVGKVIFVLYEDFLFASDTQGFLDKNAVEWVIEHQPKIIFFSGYPFYLPMKGRKEFEESIKNIEEIVSKTNVELLIVDHHACRDKKFFERYEELYNFCKEVGTKIMTAADFMGFENLFLEARRKEEVKGWERILKIL